MKILVKFRNNCNVKNNMKFISIFPFKVRLFRKYKIKKHHRNIKNNKLSSIFLFHNELIKKKLYEWFLSKFCNIRQMNSNPRPNFNADIVDLKIKNKFTVWLSYRRRNYSFVKWNSDLCKEPFWFLTRI